jgi:glycosyltransferase involved in cell wall biosynthesis
MTREVSPEREKNDYIIKDPPIEELKENTVDLEIPPKVSFCIPTKNNEATIDRCLESIINQDYPNTEIIIVDGHSTDRTLEIILKYTDNIYFDEGPLGSARQTSIERATGEILALFDSDIVIPHKDWLKGAIRYFNYSNKVSTVWPANVAPPEGSMTSKLYFNFWRVTIEDRINKKRGIYGGGNALFLKSAVDAVGGIDRSIHWGEDFDLALKLKNKGYQVVFIEDPLWHDTMQTLKEFRKKQITGARTFAKTGTGFLGLSIKDVMYEHFVLGTKGMVRGILVDKDASWMLFPLLVSIRVGAYMYIFITNIESSRELAPIIIA